MAKKPIILSVDDEADIRKSVQDVLEDAGFNVETAVDGNDCLKKLIKIKPDVILLDILMLGLTTKEIITGIKKIYPHVPVIFLTVVKLSEATKKELINTNMADFIEKPFDNKDLVQRIKKVLHLQ